MNIAIIGSGNIGTALAKALSQAGHCVQIGSRVPEQDHLKILAGAAKITAVGIGSAVITAEVIIIAVPIAATLPVVNAFLDVRDKIILETTYSFGETIPGYKNATEAISKLTGCTKVAKCFNTIGAEKLKDLRFGDLGQIPSQQVTV